MNYEIMNGGELLRYAEPETTLERALLDALREALELKWELEEARNELLDANDDLRASDTRLELHVAHFGALEERWHDLPDFVQEEIRELERGLKGVK